MICDNYFIASYCCYALILYFCGASCGASKPDFPESCTTEKHRNKWQL